MTTAKHTTGPWGVIGTDGECRVEAPKKGRSHMVIVEQVGGYRLGECFNDFSEVEANARLIAAAPEMLDALQAARKLLGDFLPAANSNAMKAMKKVDGAIHKALTGVSK